MPPTLKQRARFSNGVEIPLDYSYTPVFSSENLRNARFIAHSRVVGFLVGESP